MTDIEALIAGLEAASEGSRELDAEIGRACGAEPKIKPVRSRTHFIGGEAVKLGDKEVWPPYTVSLDAALTLVPEGAWWSMQSLPNPHIPDPRASASVTSDQKHEFVSAATPALALCIAALKTRSEIPRGTGDGE